MASARGVVVAAAVLAAVAAAWMLLEADPPAPVMGTTSAIAVPPPAPAAPPAAAPPSVVLSAVAVGSGGQRLAIASIDGAADVLLRVGDVFGDGALVSRIDETSMTYRHAGRDVTVSLPARPAPPAASPARPAATLPANPGLAAPPPMATASDGRPGSGNQAFRQAVEAKMQSITGGR